MFLCILDHLRCQCCGHQALSALLLSPDLPNERISNLLHNHRSRRHRLVHILHVSRIFHVHSSGIFLEQGHTWSLHQSESRCLLWHFAAGYLDEYRYLDTTHTLSLETANADREKDRNSFHLHPGKFVGLPRLSANH